MKLPNFNQFKELLAQAEKSPLLLLTLVSTSATGVVAFALYVVLKSLG